MTYFLDDIKPPPRNDINPTFTLLTTELFDKLDGVRRENLGDFRTITEKKAFIIRTFMETFRTHIGIDIYPSVKLIFPEKVGRLYFIKETALARLVIKMYKIPKETDDYNLLHNWNKSYQPSKRFASDEKKLRDLPLQASRVIGKRRQFNGKPSEYTVDEINRILDQLVLAKLSQDQIELLKPVFDSLSISEVRWLIQIILKKSILVNVEKFFFNFWHPDGYRVFTICNDLQKSFQFSTDPQERLDGRQLEIHPFYKFKPQLAEKLTTSYTTLIKKLQKKHDMDERYEKLFNQLELQDKFYIEEKMDGDRMLLHKDGDNFKFFSRRLKDYSFLYGETFGFGSLTKFLKNAFANNVKSVILDGEMVAYDYKREAILPFGTLKSSAIQESVRQFTTIDQYEQQTSYPYFLIFDILYLNGKDLTNFPLFFRKNILNRILSPVPHRFEVHDTRLGSSKADIERAIREVVHNRSEGLVLKNVQSKYAIDGYRNPDWIKVKPEYLEKFGENLDLVVIGKVPAIKNSYMCGLKNIDDGAYYSFCICANGFEIEEFDKIERLTHGKWIKTDVEMPPESLIKFGTKIPTYWIHPKDSLVLEIRARSIDTSMEKTYAVGSTLHNNHCRKIREDKSIDECVTLQEYFQIKENYSKDLTKAQTALSKKRAPLYSFTDLPDLKEVKKQSDLFDDFEFLILSDWKNGNTTTTMDDLKMLVKKYGGKIVNSIDVQSQLQIIVITEKDLPVSNQYLKRGIDLIKPIWIQECIDRGRILQLEPYFVFATNNWTKFDDMADKYGDSYIIHQPLNFIVPKLSNDELDKLRDDYDWGDSKPLVYLFRNIPFHVLGDSLNSQLLQDRIERFNGEIKYNFLECFYIVIPDKLHSREQTLAQVNRMSKQIAESMVINENGSTSRIPCFVTESFITKSIDLNSIVDPDDFKFI
ncbi:LIG4 DNA ligase 4 [Candida maltosa Xu316]|uniref:DNA ligase n=1 Tax=Candida maltosa (strain Xu316) TaxID=1245528 RepID=M3HTE8_CANMX|nr:DNA ligase [Candida maltosa Xu316]